MNSEKQQTLQVAALTVLRILIGWHFLYEGLAKMMKPDWSAAGFLIESKWIFAPVFQWMADNPKVLDVVDFLNIWGLTAIGLALILGIFTRSAGVAGMGLILLYYICNPPFVGLHYSLPMEGNYLIVNKNLVEMAALFVVAVMPGSRSVGLDRIIDKLWKK